MKRFNLSEIREELDRLTQEPVSPLFELVLCLAGIAMLFFLCWLF